jgi:hypothetical protein
MADGLNTRIVTEYVHGGPDASDEYSDLWPTDAPQQRRYHYCLYEEEVQVEVDLDSGAFRYIGFAGKKLAEPSDWH